MRDVGGRGEGRVEDGLQARVDGRVFREVVQRVDGGRGRRVRAGDDEERAVLQDGILGLLRRGVVVDEVLDEVGGRVGRGGAGFPGLFGFLGQRDWTFNLLRTLRRGAREYGWE